MSLRRLLTSSLRIVKQPATERRVTAMAVEKKTLTIEGQECEIVREGLAEILNHRSTAQKVFYNPIQQFNRDLSVLAIRAFAEDLAVIKKRRREKESQKAKHHGPRRGQKRKRSHDDKQPGPREIVNGIATAGENQQSVNGLEHGEKHGEGTVVQSDAEPTEPKVGREIADGSNGIERAPHKPPFRILDALSATGLRALRYAKEIPTATYITANDVSPSATNSINLNVRHNAVEGLVHPTTGDARTHMYSCVSSAGHADQRLYQVVDLDPYGTAAPFLDAAVQALSDGGLLCVTCTDAGVFASAGYLEKTYSLYSGLPLKGSQSHEGGLRLILHAISTSAARYGIAIEPLLSLSIDFYARLFVRIRKSPADVKFLAGKTMIVYNCDSGCGAWSTQYLTQTKEKTAKNGDTCYTFSLAQAPSANQHCEHCGFKTHLSGPMWGGPLHNSYFIQRILDMLPSLDKEVYGTTPRLEGMLTLAMNETIFDDPFLRPSSADAPAETEPPEEASAEKVPFGSLAARKPVHHPFFILPSQLCKVLHCVAPSDAAFRGALLHLGYRTTRSHTKPGSIVTDAPWSIIWEVMREWVRQKAPIKDRSLKEGMAGWAVMRKGRGREIKEVDKVKEELRQLIEENSQSVETLKTELEAVLYRMTVAGGKARNGVKSEGDERIEPNINGTSASLLTESRIGQRQIDPNTLTINFDEALGKETTGKRLVRYQVNPRADWGPMSRANG